MESYQGTDSERMKSAHSHQSAHYFGKRKHATIVPVGIHLAKSTFALHGRYVRSKDLLNSAALQPKLPHHLGQPVCLGAQRVSRCGRLLHQGGVLLGHLVDLADGLVDLADA